MNNEQLILESTYFHTMTVKRSVETSIDNIDSFIDVDIYSNVTCAISKSSKSMFNTNQTISKNEINYFLALFCSPSYIINTGDRIHVTFENGQVKKYKAGEGFYYPSHAEIPLLREGEA